MNIPFKSKLSRYKNIENRNKKFESLSDKEKRQEIAYDGLMLVVEKRVNHAKEMFYWSDSLLKIRANSPAEFQLMLQNLPKMCEVCADGLIMLSQIRLSNSVASWNDSRECGNTGIIKGFNMSNMARMREAYDYSYFKMPFNRQTKPKLANICCNVIQNGNFKTTDKKDYLKLWGIKL